MSDAIIIACIASIPPTLVALGAWRRSHKNTAEVKKNRVAVQELHFTINSRMTELIEAVRASAHAKGVIEGVAQERAEQIERTK